MNKEKELLEYLKTERIKSVKDWNTHDNRHIGISQDDALILIRCLSNNSRLSRIISESDKPKGLDLEKLELKLDNALERDYPYKERTAVCTCTGNWANAIVQGNKCMLCGGILEVQTER